MNNLKIALRRAIKSGKILVGEEYTNKVLDQETGIPHAGHNYAEVYTRGRFGMKCVRHDVLIPTNQEIRDYVESHVSESCEVTQHEILDALVVGASEDNLRRIDECLEITTGMTRTRTGWMRRAKRVVRRDMVAMFVHPPPKYSIDNIAEELRAALHSGSIDADLKRDRVAIIVLTYYKDLRKERWHIWTGKN